MHFGGGFSVDDGRMLASLKNLASSPELLPPKPANIPAWQDLLGGTTVRDDNGIAYDLRKFTLGEAYRNGSRWCYDFNENGTGDFDDDHHVVIVLKDLAIHLDFRRRPKLKVVEPVPCSSRIRENLRGDKKWQREHAERIEARRRLNGPGHQGSMVVF